VTWPSDDDSGAAAKAWFCYAAGMSESCVGCAALRQEVAELKAKVEQLTRLLEQFQRAAKRQAAPFAKEPPQEHPKTPGRKRGRRHGRHGHRPVPPPEQIDETLEAPL